MPFTAEKVAVVLKTWKLGFSRLQHDGNLLGVGKRYSRMTSKQSIQFSHTLMLQICCIYSWLQWRSQDFTEGEAIVTTQL